MTTKTKKETAPKAAAEKDVEKTTSKKSTIIEASVNFGTKKIYIRRKEVSNHLPKEIRAEAIVKLSSVFVNRQPLRGFKDIQAQGHPGWIPDISGRRNLKLSFMDPFQAKYCRCLMYFLEFGPPGTSETAP